MAVGLDVFDLYRFRRQMNINKPVLHDFGGFLGISDVFWTCVLVGFAKYSTKQLLTV